MALRGSGAGYKMDGDAQATGSGGSPKRGRPGGQADLHHVEATWFQQQTFTAAGVPQLPQMQGDMVTRRSNTTITVIDHLECGCRSPCTQHTGHWSGVHCGTSVFCSSKLFTMLHLAIYTALGKYLSKVSSCHS